MTPISENEETKPYHKDTGKKEVPRLQHGRDFPVAAKDKSEKGAVPGQKDGKDRGEGRENATDGKAREVKSSAVLHVLRIGAKVDHHSDPRLARQSQQKVIGVVTVNEVPHQCTRRCATTAHKKLDAHLLMSLSSLAS